MKIIKIILVLSLILFTSVLLIQCKKKNDKNIISGSVINQQSGQAVGGISVVLSAKTITNGTWSTQFTSIASQSTSGDGKFSFSFDNMRASDYKLTFSKTSYFTEEIVINPDLIEPGEEYNKTYFVHSEAWLKFIIKNNLPASTNDVLSYKLKKGAVTCPFGCNDSLHYLYGSSVDTLFKCKLYGSQNAIIEWIFTNNTNVQHHNDTIWIQPGDTTYYFINY